MHTTACFVHILIKKDAKQRPFVVFSIFRLCCIICVYCTDPPSHPLSGGISVYLIQYTYICKWHLVGGWAGRERANNKKSESRYFFSSDQAF